MIPNLSDIIKAVTPLLIASCATAISLVAMANNIKDPQVWAIASTGFTVAGALSSPSVPKS